MGGIFANAPIQPTVVAIQVGKIYFDAPCRYCRDGRRATMNVRPVDYIGHPMAELNVCSAHAERLIGEREARSWKFRSATDSLRLVGRYLFAKRDRLFHSLKRIFVLGIHAGFLL